MHVHILEPLSSSTVVHRVTGLFPGQTSICHSGTDKRPDCTIMLWYFSILDGVIQSQRAADSILI